MEEAIKQYHPLGKKTLFMIILKKSPVLFLLLAVLLFSLFYLNNVPSEHLVIATDILIAYLVFFLFMLCVVFFIGWLEYFRYWILIDEKSLKIRRGLISTEEIGIPYKHVRDVKIKRNILDQILGMSDVSITLSDFEDNQTLVEESIVFLPSLEKNVAVEIRDHITKRSQVEQISILGSQKI